MQQFDEALGVLERAVDFYRQRGDLDRQAGVIAQIGWIHRLRGTPEEGIARIHPLIESLERNPARHFPLACLYIALTRLYFSLGKYTEELAAAERASEEARATDNDFLRAVTETRLGVALMTVGRRDDARQVLQEAIGLTETTAIPGPTGTRLLASWDASAGVPFLSSTGAGLLESLAQMDRDSGDLERSRKYLEQALELAEQAGIPGRIGWALVKLGGLTFLLGDWPAAHAYCQRASRIFGSTDACSYPWLYTAQLGLAEGDVEEATVSLEAIISGADPHRDLWLFRQPQRLLAERDLREARPESALSRLEPLLDRPGLQEPQVTAFLPLLAWAHLQRGHETEAEEILTRCLERASAQSHRLAAVDAIRIQGMLRTQLGQWEEACSAFDEAAALAHSMPYPYAEAQAAYESGMMHVHKGEPGRAQERLQAALVIFQRLGALPDVERTEQALSLSAAT